MNRPLRVLDLFAGLGGWSAAFKARGHDVTTVDLEARFGSTITTDLFDLPLRKVAGPWDVVLASPPCEAFSVASIGHHWKGGSRAYVPRTGHAYRSKALVEWTRALIEELDPRYFWIENPRGVLRKLGLLDGLEHATVWYCRYGHAAAKPTDLWGRWPSTWTPREPCHNGNPDHEAAPRGARSGTQGMGDAAERAVIPYGLSLSVCEAVEAAV